MDTPTEAQLNEVDTNDVKIEEVFDEVAQKENAIAAPGCNDFCTVTYEAFYMMYANEKADGIGCNLLNISSGFMGDNPRTRDFCNSDDLQVRMLKNTIF
jgi:hypothetical protein